MEETEFRQVFESFLTESEEQLGDMEAALLVIDEHPQRHEPLATVFRLVHSLKGAAASVGLDPIANFTHDLESLVECLHARALGVDDRVVSRLLEAVDALREMLAAAARGKSEMRPEHSRLRETLGFLVAEATPTINLPVDPPAGFSDERNGPVAGPAADAPLHRPSARTLRVKVEKLDRIVDMMGELAIARGRLEALLVRGPAYWQAAVETHEQTHRLFVELQEQITSARMVPVGSLLRPYARMVRDTARACGKVARLVVEGGDVEMDTAVLERLREPLTHLIRNAIDHGLEPPEVRRAAGKPPHGRILVAARREGGTVVLEMSDDGAGLPRERILARAAAHGLATLGEDPARLIFAPGLSTSHALTELSGRGIGMDVVRRGVEALRGSVAVESREGQGTTVTLRIPLTLATIEGFIVGAGGETYVIPMEMIAELLELPAEASPRHETDKPCPAHGVLNLRGEALPYFRLRNVFGLGGAARGRESVVVVIGGGGRVGVVVDEIFGVQPVVIKPLGRWLTASQAVSVSTILGDGRAVLVLDVPGLIREVLERSAPREATAVRMSGHE
jgi:two-component system chemotaxis sensor kinase CheA